MEKRLKRGELIGKSLVVAESKNKANIGLKGKIIDETKNTVKIKTKEGKRKTLIKQNITIAIKTDKGEVEIKGEEIQTAPEERIKSR